MDFFPDELPARLQALCPEAGGFWVAFSGGLDSRVLLQALASVRERLPAAPGAVHVEHGLQPEAAAWAEDCRAFCASADIPFVHLQVDARAAAGESPEAAARSARYRALADWLPPGHALLTAHHQDDQAETLMLQLLRGAGPRGLAAMPARSPFARGWLLRPLLESGREDLRRYAATVGLRWIEDPSNRDRRYDRNLLRHEILPRLQQRWPATAAVLSRVAAHQAEAAGLLDELAALDAAAAAGAEAGTLSVAALRALRSPRRRNLLRYWLRGHGLPLPSSAVLARIERDGLVERADAEPCIRWPGGEVRRYRDALHALEPLPPPEASEREWAAETPLALAGGLLHARPVSGRGLARRALADGPLRIRLRQGGERLRPAGRTHQRPLKHLLQEAGVPPWERARLPLLYRGDELLAVAGLWVAEGWQAAAGESGLWLEWSRLPGRSAGSSQIVCD
ncbi:tRNA lysidine(34) synthetase TilS [Thiohalobacter sp. IOR34]|uniref:tRNA lysidine(34) synthetase TilS n=1 Tax=Thiohalobacter sp. IOR34 TaxID=3057176 RepID=UPI0025AFB360|nr:tRNA lysidine(34) synthetase TilS [Thiohalobacter sp. IOR34]WJW76593.1 tRNA lysidine(34) synthetase TilS [Thiohalobacter sp. IOR34]